MSASSSAPDAAGERALTIRVDERDNVAIVVSARGLAAGAQLVQQALQALGEDRATPVDTHQSHGLGIVVLDDLVRDAHERTAHVVPIEDDLLI